MTKKRPWIRAARADGKIVQRCKDPKKAAIYFIDFKASTGRILYPETTATKLFLDDKEYNAPIRTVHLRSPIMKFIKSKEHEKEVLKDLEYLIELHMSFYH